jgi:NitT/TauT family transport system ATP-binding protein
MTTHPLIEVKSLNHYYGPPPGGHLVLEDVNLTLNQNEVVGLLGRSARASRHCCAPSRVDPPARGFRRAHPGEDCPDPSVAMVFQTFALFPWLTVQQNVELGLEAQKVPPEERRSRALAAIDLIGLDGFENAYPKELSGGMRQRVGLARAWW